MVNPLSILLTGGETASAVADAVSETASAAAGGEAVTGEVMLQTIGMGLGTVFFGLICLILICTLTSAVIRKLEGLKKPEAAPATPAPAPAPAAPAPTSRPSTGIGARSAYERGALSAAIAAAIAEELGTDISGIRIVSIKKI